MKYACTSGESNTLTEQSVATNRMYEHLYKCTQISQLLLSEVLCAYSTAHV